jgi:LacI family transcriptional regulator
MKGSTVISPEMRNRVQEAAARLGYQAPTKSRKTSRGKTRTVGIVLDVLQNNPFMTQLLEHLHVALHEAGYQVMLFMESHVQRGTLPAAEPLIDDYLEGMIIGTASLGSRAVLDLCERGMPVVLVVRSDGSGKVDTVEIDNIHAGAEAARHLYELGHRKFALVMGPQNTSTSRDRAEGALVYLDSVGVGRDEVVLSWGEYTSDSGYSATMALLSRPDPVTAVIAANDSVAMGVLEACKRHDVEVPGQLSVVGFDDIPLAGSPLIGLTTIRQPVESMARLAARRLVDRMQMRGPTPAAKDILPVHLVSRSSTGRPRHRPDSSRESD